MAASPLTVSGTTISRHPFPEPEQVLSKSGKINSQSSEDAYYAWYTSKNTPVLEMLAYTIHILKFVNNDLTI